MEIPALRFARFPEAVWPATYQLNKENARTISPFFASFAPGYAHLRNLHHILILILSIFSPKAHSILKSFVNKVLDVEMFY